MAEVSGILKNGGGIEQKTPFLIRGVIVPNEERRGGGGVFVPVPLTGDSIHIVCHAQSETWYTAVVLDRHLR